MNVLPREKGFVRTQKAISEDVENLRGKVGHRLRGELHILVDTKANKLYVKKGLTLLWQAERREPMTVYRGDVRSWCWVEDTASAIRIALESKEAGAIDIGRSDEPVSMPDLARRACDLTGAPQDLIEEVDPPAGYIPTNADDKRLRALGWEPEVDLETGMRRVLDWLRSQSATAVS